MNALNTKKLLAASAFGLWLSGSFTVSYASPVADTVELAQAAPDEGTAAGPAEEGQDGGQRGVEQQQQEKAKRAARQQQQDAERAAKEEQRQQKDAERAERKQQQEAERAAKEQKQQEEAERAARKQQGEAEPAQQQQQQEAERATREQEREQREAERAQRKQHQETERAAKEQEKQQEEAERAAKKRQEDAEKAQTKAEERDEDQKAKADAERVRQEAAKAKVKAEKKQPDAATAGQEPDGGATRPKVEQAQPARPETDRSRADLKAQDGREGLRERRFEPKDEKQAVEQIKEERAEADAEFERAKREAAQKPAEFGALEGREIRSQEFERIRKQRRERVFVRHDEERRFERFGKRIKHERRKDGTTLSIYLSLGGVEIITVEDEDGRLLRRSRRDRDGHEIVLVDNRRFYESRPRRGSGEVFVTLPPARVRIPRSRYIVDYNEASEEDIYEALVAPPVERLDRRYSLDEVRYGYGLRERMRRVDLDAINFAFGSWEVEESQYEKLERMARVIKRILKRNPDEMFLIEGHTDAVGSDIDNLSLSDRRAESVAIILSDSFRVPPENLTTQGYGEQYLKVLTYGPSRENRRVSVRRITPLLSQAD
jgi:outer membrane protein OmpA-like peptidoglycan-associated protein